MHSVHKMWPLATDRVAWSSVCMFVPSNRQNLSSSACVEDKREDNQNCSVLCCVRQLCTMICTHMWAVLTFLLFFVCLFSFCLLCFRSR